MFTFQVYIILSLGLQAVYVRQDFLYYFEALFYGCMWQFLLAVMGSISNYEVRCVSSKSSYC